MNSVTLVLKNLRTQNLRTETGVRTFVNSTPGSEGQYASLCKMLCRSVKPLSRYLDFVFFSDEGSHHLGSLKFYIFNDRNGQERRTASLCQILSKSLKPRQIYVSFFIFLRWRPPPSWIFEIPKLLTVRTVKKEELHHCAKFCRNHSNHGGVMSVFDFSKMAAVRNLGFVMRVWGPPTKGIWRSLSLSKIWLDAVVLIICTPTSMCD